MARGETVVALAITKPLHGLAHQRITVRERETIAKQPRGRVLRKTIVKRRLVQGHRRTIGPEQKTIVRRTIAT